MISKVFSLPPFMLVGGETECLKFYLTTDSGMAYSADGCSVSFALIPYSNQDGTPVIVKDAVISSDSSGNSCYASVTLAPADTVRLHGRYIYQVSIKDDNGVVEIPGLGIIDIVRNIQPSFIL